MFKILNEKLNAILLAKQKSSDILQDNFKNKRNQTKGSIWQ